MKSFLSPLIAIFTLLTPALAQAADGWIPLFDGKSLDGWKISEKPETFSVKDGILIVKGDRAHMFYAGPVQNAEFKNFEMKLEILTKPGANSGVYLHTKFQETGWPSQGYEIQVNNTHKDPKKTAGVYGILDNFNAPVKDDEWFTMTIRVEGKHIVTKVNDKVISDYTEEENVQRPKNFAGRLISSGTVAIQGHDPGSEVHYRSIEIRPLP